MLDWGLASNAAFLFQRILQRSHYYERGTRSISRGQDRGEAHSTASPPSNQALLAAVAAAEQLAALEKQEAELAKQKAALKQKLGKK